MRLNIIDDLSETDEPNSFSEMPNLSNIKINPTIDVIRGDKCTNFFLC